MLPGAPAPAAEHADVDAVAASWGGSSAVRDRLEGLARASQSVVLFREHIPLTVTDWLAAEVAHDEQAALAAATLLERELLDGVRAIKYAGTPPLRRALRQRAHRRPPPVLRGSRARHVNPVRTVAE